MKLRPNLEEFLDDMERRYELIIYTAAEKEYADSIINFIESKKEYFAYRLYKEQCIGRQDECLFKCLDIFCKNRDVSNIVIVDNTVQNYGLSIRNGIPIKSFRGSSTDEELIYLATYLRMLSQEADFRNRIKEDFAGYLLEHSSVS